MKGAGGRARLPLVALTACAAAGLLFVSVRQGAAVLSSPAFCSSCHIMSAQYVSHRRSAHQRASCVDCHSGQGCGSCHAPGAADAAMADGRVNAPASRLHETHAPGRGFRCAECHQGMMHARIDGGVSSRPRDTCGGCHGQTEPGGSPGRSPAFHPKDREVS